MQYDAAKEKATYRVYVEMGWHDIWEACQKKGIPTTYPNGKPLPRHVVEQDLIEAITKEYGICPDEEDL